MRTGQNGRPRKRVLASLGGDLAFDSMKVERNGNLVVGTLQVGCLTVISRRGRCWIRCSCLI